MQPNQRIAEEGQLGLPRRSPFPSFPNLQCLLPGALTMGKKGVALNQKQESIPSSQRERSPRVQRLRPKQEMFHFPFLYPSLHHRLSIKQKSDPIMVPPILVCGQECKRWYSLAPHLSTFPTFPFMKVRVNQSERVITKTTPERYTQKGNQ